MLRLYIPAGVVAALIVVLTYFEAVNQDRFSSSSVTAAEFGQRFAAVPMTVGNWSGVDTEVSPDTLETAGAVNHVSRIYTNSESGERVDLWLIVGHSRDVVRHTPDICYPSQGFSQQGSVIKHRIDVPGENPATFNTAKFHSESGFEAPWQRVFWTWNGNNEEQPDWVAPDSQRIHFGNNSALYKMYFTATMGEKDEPVSDSVALKFAAEMLPEVNRTLFPERYVGKAKPASGPASDGADGENKSTSDAAESEAPVTDSDAAEPSAANDAGAADGG